MIAFNVNANHLLLAKLQRLNRRLPEQSRIIMRRSVSPFAQQQVARRLKNPIPPQRWFGPWTSPRQRGAYWGGIPNAGIPPGFGKWASPDSGPPTIRTGGMQKWQVRAQYNTKSRFGEIIVSNPEAGDYFEYVVGNKQQGFHANAGWYNLDEEVAIIRQEVYNWAIAAYGDMIDSELDNIDK